MTGFGEQPNTTKRPWIQKPWSSATNSGEEINLLLHNLAHRCARCKRTTDLVHLDDHQHCPDCRGKNGFR